MEETIGFPIVHAVRSRQGFLINGMKISPRLQVILLEIQTICR
jgi:hypothetical protein